MSSPARATRLSRLRQQHQRALMLVWLTACTLLAVVWWHNLGQIRDSREREINATQRDLGNLTRVAQEHADRTIHSADQVLRFVQARYVEQGRRLDLTSLTHQGTIDAENFPQVGVIDPQGIYLLANLPIHSRIDLSDREHFRVHVPPGDRGLFVSKPVLGRASGKWSIQLTRRISLPGGEFGGVAVLSLDPGYFTRFYSDLRLGEHGVATLIGMDGIARARRSGSRHDFGTDLSRSGVMPLLAAGRTSGFYTSRSPVDNVERLLHFRRLERFPLVVVVGLSLEEVLGNHRITRDALLMQSGLVSLLVVALGGVLTRHLVRMRRDLEARDLAQLQLQERNEQINAIFALSPDGFVGFDSDGRLSFVNPAFRQMTGAEEQQFDGISMQAFDARAAMVLQGPGRHAKIIVTPGRRVLQVGARQSDLASVSRILYFRDVTHETEVDQIKSEFLSTAAHELRTPMASIYGFAEVLLTQPASDDERREFTGIIFEQAGNMARILDELLDLARMEARRGKDFRLAALDLKAQTQDIIRSYRQPPGRMPPTLVAPDGPMPIEADADKLRQALLNVLSNAYKYSPDGGSVTLTLSHDRTGAVPQVCIDVQDQGIGMAPEACARIFERFFRADTSGLLPGTGLGMSIVKEIFDLHGGAVTVDSAVGRGTTVHMRLPVMAAGMALPREELAA
jgi:signal transduction histidine kinase